MIPSLKWLIVTVGILGAGALIAPDQAAAFHHGAPHTEHHGERPIFDRDRHHQERSYEDQGGHRSPHHRGCREVEYQDRHGRFGVRTVCD